MKYHYGVCIKESNWIKGHSNSIVVLAGDSNDHRLSFFVKIFDKEEEVDDNTKNIKFGNAVFFASEKENIIDLYDVDCMFNSNYSNLKFNNLYLEFNYQSGILKVLHQDKKHLNAYWPKDEISKVERELMFSLYKGRLYNTYLSSLSNITAENIQNIIREEEKEIEFYDIEDLINELKISYYTTNFYIRTDEPESYDFYERRSFEKTKYENYKFDAYLTQILMPGEWLIGEYEGWFYANEDAKEKEEQKYRDIPWLKAKMKQKYSKSEHLNYRVRAKLSKFVSPLFSMLTIPGNILELKKNPINNCLLGFEFYHCSNNKEFILSDFRRAISTFRYNTKDNFKDKIYKNLSLDEMLKEWCIPFPICTKESSTVCLF